MLHNGHLFYTRRVPLPSGTASSHSNLKPLLKNKEKKISEWNFSWIMFNVMGIIIIIPFYNSLYKPKLSFHPCRLVHFKDLKF